MSASDRPEDRGSRWEKAAQDRRQDGGLGLPAGFTVPGWLPIVAFAFLVANAIKQAVQAERTFDLVWAAVGIVLWGSLLVVLLRRRQPKAQPPADGGKGRVPAGRSRPLVAATRVRA